MTHVVDGPGNHRTDDDPECAGQVAELGGEDRPEQGTGSGDGCKMMAKITYLLVAW